MKTKLFSYPMIAAYGGITSGLIISIRDGNGFMDGIMYGLIVGVLLYAVTCFIEWLIVNFKSQRE